MRPRPPLRARLPYLLFAAVLLLGGCKSDQVDLSRGGTELDYRCAGKHVPADVEAARKAVSSRLSSLGLAARVLADGERLRVQLPKSAEASLPRVKRLLGIAGRFEVREIDDGGALRSLGPSLPEDSGARVVRDSWTDHLEATKGAFSLVAGSAEAARRALESAGFKPPDGVEMLAERPIDPAQIRLYGARPAALRLAQVKEVRASLDRYLPPEVSLVFTEQGAKDYQELTRKALGRKIAFVVDSQIVETAVVLAPVALGRASISQAFSGTREERLAEAELLAAALRSPLEVELALDEERPLAATR